VGTFELATVTIAASVGIARAPALAFAVLLHVTTLLITSIAGAVAYAMGSRRRHRAAVAETVPEGDPG